MDRSRAARRRFLAALGGAPLLVLLPREGAAAGRPPLIGVLANHVPKAHLELGTASPFHGTAAFVDGLRAKGWRDGENVRIVWRSAESRMERLAALVSELVRMPVDIIVGGDDAAESAIRATRTIPVVAYSISNPVERRIARTLSRPGGNVTGITTSAGAELQKSLAWLKEASPRIRHVALVAQSHERADNHPGLRAGSPLWAAGATLGIELSFMSFGDTDTLPEVVRSAVRQGVHALMIDSNYAIHYHREVRERLAAEVIRARMPVMHLALTAAADGALMSTGDDLTARWRRTSYFVDRILRGEKPGDIPIEHVDNFRFHVNLTAAKAIGLKLPPRLILQADRVFE